MAYQKWAGIDIKTQFKTRKSGGRYTIKSDMAVSTPVIKRDSLTAEVLENRKQSKSIHH